LKMDIRILDSHLREYLDTKASPQEIARYVSLCGPTFDRTRKLEGDYLYEIEVTTNRVDAASVVGIAREAAAILPQFGIKAKFKRPGDKKIDEPKGKNLPLKITADLKLERRLTGVVFENFENFNTPKWMKSRLEASGVRSLNAVIDITNYVMITTGHPCHAFDYDKIKGSTISVRESKKGETITTLDGKKYKLLGGDIIFEDKDKRIIDLPGIMGLENSVVSKNTKRVLLFFDNNDPVRIRRTSMGLAIRTMAATMNEKNVDPELINISLSLGAKLFTTICKASIASKVYDFYPKPYKTKRVSTSNKFITKIMGVKIEKGKINSLLTALEFNPKWDGDKLSVSIPSFRAEDINIEEDIVEEVARIYGYHNLPSELMLGKLPEPVFNTPFEFEENLRQTLKALGGAEVLTYSLVSKGLEPGTALRLKNPLGIDTEYLRTSLKPSLLEAVKTNIGLKSPYHLFEIANIYLPKKADLPEERMMLAGILTNYDFRKAKGVVEELLSSLNISLPVKIEKVGSNYYYEFEVEKLEKHVRPKTFTPIPKYPPQIEDITVTIPEGKRVGEVVQFIKQTSNLIQSIELVDVYERNFTFRISYQHPEKTLSDKEVEKIRAKIDKNLS